MFKWLAGDEARTKDTKAFSNVTEGLQRSYKDKLLPVERSHLFHHMYSPALTDADFSARPMVLLTGQYSTGKSTFIRHLLGRDYPGLRIGPEPTTDKFVAIIHGESDQVIPGNAVSVDASLPFTQLAHHGNAFLSRFEVSRLPCQVLEGITLVDTPGVLSGEKQRLNRGYDFEAVIKWFADRVDMIMMLFDVSKLDISDEFRRVILALKGNDSKVHVILNKADRVSTPQLMRVYGALMWSLGKVMDTPEVSRVFIGSFWDEPLHVDEQRKLFESEENDLYTALAQLPRSAAVRKLNDLIKRARLAKVNAYLLEHLRKSMPKFMGIEKEKNKLLSNLLPIYDTLVKTKGLTMGDFPDPAVVKAKLQNEDLTKLTKLDKKAMERLESMLTEDIPQLLKLVPQEQANEENANLTQMGNEASPFAVMKVGGKTETSVFQPQWLEPPDTADYRADFEALRPNADGKITGQKAKGKMVESKLPSTVLHKIWTISDVDKDGFLTLHEYSLAMHFIAMKLDGQDLPATCPANMLPNAVS